VIPQLPFKHAGKELPAAGYGGLVATVPSRPTPTPHPPLQMTSSSCGGPAHHPGRGCST
jgi:hypothetical protein